MRISLTAALFGITSSVGWAFGFSPVYYRLYLLVGSPMHPPYLLSAISITTLSFAFGVVGAIPCRFLAPGGGAAFVVVTVTSLVASRLFFVGFAHIGALLASYGFWSFVLGALVVLRWRVPRA